jgi:chemotaxis protein CheD
MQRPHDKTRVYVSMDPPGVVRVVGISEMIVTNERGVTLVTYSLGSCIALAVHDPVAVVGGLIHCMLPFSKIDPDKASQKPSMFVDTGVPALLQAVFNLGATRKNLVAKVAGAARMIETGDPFNIGERNYTVLRKVLWKNNILLAGEVVGGVVSRSVYLDMNSGQTVVRAGAEKRVF